MAFDLKGKIVLITGGTGGIGFCSTKELLRSGIQGITIADIDEQRGHEVIKDITAEFGPNRALFVKTDVIKPDELEAAFKLTVEKWKAIDVVINNAGIMNDGQWQLELALNCGALVQGSLLALKYMGKDKGGKGGVILNMGSTLGLRHLDSLPIYVGTKHFVVGFSLSLGEPYHYKRTGVKVITLCPAGTNTGLIPASIQNPFENSSEIGENIDKLIKSIILQKPESVAQAMVTAISKGESGSVWVVENDEPTYRVHIPDRLEFKRY